MAAHNSSLTIGSAIESILDQTRSDWELLLVDDASTDDTVDIAKGYGDGRIKVTTLVTNSGSGTARNVGLRAARGKLFSVMDADDVSHWHRLQVAVDMFEADEGLTVAAGQVAEFGAWGGPVVTHWPTADHVVAQRQRRRLVPVPHPSSTMRTAAALAVGGYDECCRRAQDYALFLRLGDQRMRCSPEVVLDYRTTRPLAMKYAVDSARYAQLALQRNAEGGLRRGQLPVLPAQLPGSLRTDLRATAQWPDAGLGRPWATQACDSGRPQDRSGGWSFSLRPYPLEPLEYGAGIDHDRLG